MPLEADAVYISDLLGMRVIDVSAGGRGRRGRNHGCRARRRRSGDARNTHRGRREAPLPFVRAYLRKTDIEAARLEMELPQGLLAMQKPSRNASE